MAARRTRSVRYSSRRGLPARPIAAAVNLLRQRQHPGAKLREDHALLLDERDWDDAAAPEDRGALLRRALDALTVS